VFGNYCATSKGVIVVGKWGIAGLNLGPGIIESVGQNPNGLGFKYPVCVLSDEPAHAPHRLPTVSYYCPWNLACKELVETATKPSENDQGVAFTARNTDQSSFARRRNGVVMLIVFPRMSRFTRAWLRRQ
jgi:hypothetical protein